jgi:hypothetical protein
MICRPYALAAPMAPMVQFGAATKVMVSFF